MVETTRVVNLSGDDELPAWQTVIELDQAEIAATWTLVGGLMVYAHARAARLNSPRPTADADFLVDVVAARTNLGEVRSSLRTLGFDLDSSYSTAYRYRHTDGRLIDVMVADHLPSHIRARLAGRPAFQAPAGQQAINRRQEWRLEFSPEFHCTVGIPNVLGALVAKGAAWIVDARNPERHLQDAATLFAAMGDASAIEYDSLTNNDRKRLRALRARLRDGRDPAWSLLSADERLLGQQNLQLFGDAAGI